MEKLIFMLSLLPMLQSGPLRSLQDLKWKERVLLYFPENGKSLHTEGLDAEMGERRLTWFDFGGSVRSNFSGAIHPDFKNEVLKHYKHLTQGTWILIGLDGGIKLSGTGPPDWRVVFATIDSMPMRKAEIRRRN